MPLRLVRGPIRPPLPGDVLESGFGLHHDGLARVAPRLAWIRAAREHLPRGIATLAGARETHTGVVPQREALFLAGIAILPAPQFGAGRGDFQIQAARVRIALT